jgi:hypothetical protein
VAYRGNNHLATYNKVGESGVFKINLKRREGKEHTGEHGCNNQLATYSRSSDGLLIDLSFKLRNLQFGPYDER